MTRGHCVIITYAETCSKRTQTKGLVPVLLFNKKWKHQTIQLTNGIENTAGWVVDYIIPGTIIT